MRTLLYLTDLSYKARGRKYYEEDLYITSKLQVHFNVLIGNPRQAISYIDCADLIVFRNTGPVLNYLNYFQEFLKTIDESKITTFNSFDGKADIKGKQYLLELYELGFPVIPTIEDLSKIEALGHPKKYIIKIKNGADSIGMELLNKDELAQIDPRGKLIQPFLDFEYEVSFFYLNDTFQYALYAPDKTKRWELAPYEPTPSDLSFAGQFIEWNAIERGITRVDACRLADNSLLLLELEDLNPYLSIDLLPEDKRSLFMENLIRELKSLAP
ncbi:hypothetical protein [Pseudozobellia thermophila]|uniref:Glutathione synthase/RimK-type ligase, ATP-grasp superfamily n=1 Tax=Pseudozobellia thermophila TaxID=192903 RepID=A0A1M6NLK9_9FLAO|nr:hypothetical protein [Pseudozobellia thermophila]SHJ96601.1 hypothetical protein SAMN04488513_11414 [Pseudozobellia thermophila]